MFYCLGHIHDLKGQLSITVELMEHTGAGQMVQLVALNIWAHVLKGENFHKLLSDFHTCATHGTCVPPAHLPLHKQVTDEITEGS